MDSLLHADDSEREEFWREHHGWCDGGCKTEVCDDAEGIDCVCHGAVETGRERGAFVFCGSCSEKPHCDVCGGTDGRHKTWCPEKPVPVMVAVEDADTAPVKVHTVRCGCGALVPSADILTGAHRCRVL